MSRGLHTFATLFTDSKSMPGIAPPSRRTRAAVGAHASESDLHDTFDDYSSHHGLPNALGRDEARQGSIDRLCSVEDAVAGEEQQCGGHNDLSQHFEALLA
jgi:hypothetical protein